MRRQTIYLIIAIIVLVSAGVFWYAKRDAAAPLVTVERNLTREQKETYEQKIQQAETYIKSLQPSQPGFAQELSAAYVNLGQLYYGLGQLSKAEAAFDRAFSLDKNNYNSLVAKSLSQSERRDFFTARASLEKALEIASNVPDLWLRYISLTKTNFPENRQELPSMFDRALAGTNRYPDILAAYAQYLEEQGNLEGARKIWKEASDAVPGHQLYIQEYQRLGGK